MPLNSLFLDQICIASTLDPLILDIKQWPHHDNNTYKLMDNLLYFEECFYVLEGPLRLQVFQAQHDFFATKHLGFNKTLEFVSRDFLWPQI